MKNNNQILGQAGGVNEGEVFKTPERRTLFSPNDSIKENSCFPPINNSFSLSGTTSLAFKFNYLMPKKKNFAEDLIDELNKGEKR